MRTARLCASAWLLAQGVAAAADGAAAGSLLDDILANSRWVIGGSLGAAPQYSGSSRREVKPNLLYAYQYGRFRFSTGGASGLLNFGTDVAGPGATAELKTSGKVKVGAGLRVDTGRRSSDSPDLAGVPDVRRTLRGRVYASTQWGEHWTASTNFSQDLLGRQGGALLTGDIGYAFATSPRTTWTAGFGLTLADGRHMRSYYGVSPEVSQRTGFASFEPGAGAQDAHAGVGVTTALTSRWIAFASLNGARLLGDAAASPLTRNRSTMSASIGIGWRCCNQ